MVLKNIRHEKFAFALFMGMNQENALIEAGYSLKWARSSASRIMSTNANIRKRVAELHKEAEGPGVMTEIERKERLSELAKEPIKQPITAREVVMSIAELNKMEKVYTESVLVNEDKRVINVFVVDKEAKELIARVKERTGNLIDEDEDN